MSDEQLTLGQLLDLLPGLVDAAIRARDTKAPDPIHALTSLKTGVVVNADSTIGEVQLDDDPAGVTVQVQLATLADVGDRVIVLTRSGGGAYAIGNGQLQGQGTNPFTGGTFEILEQTIPLPLSGGTIGPGTFSWSHAAGDTLMDLSTPTRPTFITPSVYAVKFAGQEVAGLGGTIEMFTDITNSTLYPTVSDLGFLGASGGFIFLLFGGAGSITWPFAAGDWIQNDYLLIQPGTADCTLHEQALICKIV